MYRAVISYMYMKYFIGMCIEFTFVKWIKYVSCIKEMCNAKNIYCLQMYNNFIFTMRKRFNHHRIEEALHY